MDMVDHPKQPSFVWTLHRLSFLPLVPRPAWTNLAELHCPPGPAIYCASHRERPDDQLSRIRKAAGRDRGQGRGAARAGAGRTARWMSRRRPAALDKKADALLKELYKDLNAWQKCQVARHPDRPHCRDYIDALFTECTPLAGDRNFADDHAVMGGLARFSDQAGGGDRPREGPRHQDPDRAQFRHGAARGLSQGDPADGSGRPLRPAGHHAGRHARRLSRQGRRGARPVRGDRPGDREVA